MLLNFNFSVDSNTVALVVAVGSFIFTLYQWLINLNSRRPNLKLVRFQLGRILLNHDYKDFILYPKTNFILVNLSDLPNSILDMKFHCNIGGKWYEGRCDGAQDFFPIFVQGHSSEMANKERILAVSFPIFPSPEELKNAKLLVELYDQYDRVYRIRFDSKWMAKANQVKIPYFNEKEESLGEIRHGDSVHHIVYNKPEQTVGLYEFSRYGQGRGGTYFTPDVVKNAFEGKTETKVSFTSVGPAQIYFTKENGGSLEAEVDGKLVKKITLPKEFC